MALGTRQHFTRSHSQSVIPDAQLGTKSVATPNIPCETQSHVLDSSSPRTQLGTSRTQPLGVSRSSIRKPRGLAQNNSLTKHLKATGQKPRIEIRQGMARPLGHWAKEFATEVGIICRTYAPLTCRDWRLVKRQTRQRLHCHILEKFDIDLEIPYVERAVNRYMGQRFKDFRCRLHKHYQKFENEDQCRQNPYKGMTREMWEVVCGMFETREFKELSAKNKISRQQLKVNHCAGSKPFARYREEMRDKDTQQELGRIELYRLTHSKENKWTCSEAENNYNCMVELQKHSALEESTSLTEDEICDKVLGTRPGYIKGLGHGVLPISTSNCSQFDLSNVILRAENAERRNAELTTQLQQQILQTQEQNRKIEELESWRNTMATRWDTFMRQFSGDGSSM